MPSTPATPAPGSPDPDRLRELFRRASAVPAGAERDAILAQGCAGDAALRDRLDALLRAHDTADSLLDPPPLPSGSPSAADTVAPGSPTEDGAGDLIAGRYKLLEQIGVGGMGVVWMAEQRIPVRRYVALKLVKAGMDSRAVLARFNAERQALAMMDHPNIARVLDGGATDRGSPFFVMELVRGLPVTRYCDEKNLSVRQRLDLFVQVCSAVQHAHQKGIIHRDLKPSNVLVTEHDGKPVPKVIDFGLAKALAGTGVLTDETLFTAFGHAAGTPLYMAPEQVAINAIDIDTRADIYALGVLLYELLTGTPPHDRERMKKAAWDEIRRIVREEEPPRPSLRLATSAMLPSLAATRQTEPARLPSLVKGDLDWIVLKTLEKDRNRRYDTAAGLAADIGRHLSGDPVQAAPPSTAYRARKFARKHRGPVLAATAITAALILGTAGIAWQWQRAEAAFEGQRAATTREATERQRAESAATRESAARATADTAANSERQQRRIADEANHRSRRLSYELAVRAGFNALGTGNAAELLRSMNDAPEELRGWEWRLLSAERDTSIYAVGGSDFTVQLARFSPNGSRLAVIGADNLTIIVNTLDGRELTRFRAGDDPIADVGFSPSGNQLLATSNDGKLRVFDSATGQPVPMSHGPFTSTTLRTLPPDGRSILANPEDGTIRVRDVASGRDLVAIGAVRGGITGASFAPDGQSVLTRHFGKSARLWDARSGVPLSPPMQHSGTVFSDAWSPDGRLVATAELGSGAYIWDAATGKQVYFFDGDGTNSPDIAFSPDGSRFVVGGSGKIARVYDLKTGRKISELKGHLSDVTSACFSPDGTKIVTSSEDRTARVWDPASGEPLLTLLGHQDSVRHASFSPDGSTIVTYSADGTARVWHAWKGRSDVPESSTNMRWRFATRVTTDGRKALMANWNGHDASVHVRDVKSGGDLLVLRGLDTHPCNAALSRDGATLVTTSEWENNGHLWNLATGKRSRLKAPGPTFSATSCALSSDGRRVAIGHGTGDVFIWNLSRRTTPTKVSSPERQASASSIQFSADGTRLVITNFYGLIRVVDSDSGEVLTSISTTLTGLRAASFAPDGRRIMMGSDDKIARIWDVASGRELVALHGHTDTVTTTTFSSDGARAFTGSSDQTVRIWDSESGRELGVLVGMGSFIDWLGFSADGTRLMAGAGDGTVRLWDVAPRRERHAQDLAESERESNLRTLVERVLDEWAPATRPSTGAQLLPHPRVIRALDVLRRFRTRVVVQRLVPSAVESKRVAEMIAEVLARRAVADARQQRIAAARAAGLRGVREIPVQPSEALVSTASLYRKLATGSSLKSVEESVTQDTALSADERGRLVGVVRDEESRVELLGEVMNAALWKMVAKKDSLAPNARGAAINHIELINRLFDYGLDDLNVRNTVGMAEYRVGRFAKAVEVIQKNEGLYSGEMRKEEAADMLVLALSFLKLGRQTEADQSRLRFEQAALSLGDDDEIIAWRVEMARDFGTPAPSVRPTTQPTTRPTTQRGVGGG